MKLTEISPEPNRWPTVDECVAYVREHFDAEVGQLFEGILESAQQDHYAFTRAIAGVCLCHYHATPLGQPDEVEYEPTCPVHSEHLFDPRKGMWIFADPELNAAWEESAASVTTDADLDFVVEPDPAEPNTDNPTLTGNRP